MNSGRTEGLEGLRRRGECTWSLVFDAGVRHDTFAWKMEDFCNETSCVPVLYFLRFVVMRPLEEKNSRSAASRLFISDRLMYLASASPLQ
jgi:hypothetical protein